MKEFTKLPAVKHQHSRHKVIVCMKKSLLAATLPRSRQLFVKTDQDQKSGNLSCSLEMKKAIDVIFSK